MTRRLGSVVSGMRRIEECRGQDGGNELERRDFEEIHSDLARARD